MIDSNDILSVLPCAYVSFHDDGLIINCNISLEDWVGLPRESLVGKSIENVFTLSTRIFYNTHFFPLIKLHSKASEIFFTLKDRDDQHIPVLANAQRILTDNVGVIHCVFVRVEQRKKFEQELLDARRNADKALSENKLLNELTKSLEYQTLQLDKQYQRQLSVNENLLSFSKVISHDLQEPIRKIRIFADMLSKDPIVNCGRNEILIGKIEASAERLKLLTDSLGHYVTIDAESEFSPIDLNVVVNAAQKKAIELRQYSDFEMVVGKMPVIDGYGSQLELMFFHLIDNAIQFRDHQRPLRIEIGAVIIQDNAFRTSPDRYKFVDYVRISFKDNGSGFAVQYKEYVFGLLSKIDKENSGLGVGLSLVKKVVDNHFGRVSLDSAPDRGTRLEIEIPQKMEAHPNLVA